MRFSLSIDRPAAEGPPPGDPPPEPGGEVPPEHGDAAKAAEPGVSPGEGDAGRANEVPQS